MVSKIRFKKYLPYYIAIPVTICLLLSGFLYIIKSEKDSQKALLKDKQSLTIAKNNLDLELASVSGLLSSTSAELATLKSVDQFKRNEELQSTIKEIETTYSKSVSVYEALLGLPTGSKKIAEFEKLFANSINLLSKRNYSSASAQLVKLDGLIKTESDSFLQASASKLGENIAVINTPPSSGFRRQNVTIDIGTYTVDIVTADLNSTRVIVDTASESDCKDNCPVMALGDYVARSGAYAGINGAYFCPASYPSCAGKTNSYDTLLMNKNKKYFNSDNNVYSTVPAVIFQSGSMRFIGQSLEWGRDTGVDSVLANQPLLLSCGNVVFGGDGDPKKGSKGSRGFVGSTGSAGYIGVVYNATVAEAARVLKGLGVQNALNLDSGGSTALWSGGYKAGPGRNIPNAILFVRK